MSPMMDLQNLSFLRKRPVVYASITITLSVSFCTQSTTKGQKGNPLCSKCTCKYQILLTNVFNNDIHEDSAKKKRNTRSFQIKKQTS